MLYIYDTVVRITTKVVLGTTHLADIMPFCFTKGHYIGVPPFLNTRNTSTTAKHLCALLCNSSCTQKGRDVDNSVYKWITDRIGCLYEGKNVAYCRGACR